MTDAAKLAISGLGMVCAVGCTVEGSCAAIRSGLGRAGPVEDLDVWDPEEEDTRPLSGHAVAEVTSGYQGMGRWMRLAGLALADLLRYSGLGSGASDQIWRRAGLVVALPEQDPRRFLFPRSEVAELPRRLLDRGALAIPPTNAVSIAEGHSGAMTALAVARDEIRAGRWDRAIVLGIDSLLDEDSLRWLGESGRLRTPERAVGLAPGEAAACVLVEHPGACVGRPEASLDSVAIAEEPDGAEGTLRLGVALSTAIERALETASRPDLIGDVLGDLNGEEARAMAWGNAFARTHGMERLRGARTSFPAASIGDVGAASAAVSLCAAVRSLVRGYARGGAVLVWARSDSGKAGACVVTRAT